MKENVSGCFFSELLNTVYVTHRMIPSIMRI